MTRPEYGAWQETAGHFTSGSETLFGIITKPTGTPRGIGVVLLNAGSWIPAMNRNGLWVDIARRSAADGYHVLRFDYHGVGESTGDVNSFQITRPFARDLYAAVEHLKTSGVQHVILYGWCFGARLALHCGANVSGLLGTIALSLPVVDSEAGLEGSSAKHDLKRALNKQTLKRMLDPRHRHIYLRIINGRIQALRANLAGRFLRNGDARQWVSRGFFRDMKASVSARVPTLMIHGSEDMFYAQFKRAAETSLAELIAGAAGAIDVEVVDGEVHRLLSTEMQDVVIRRTPDWLQWAVEQHAGGTAVAEHRA